MMVGNVMAFFGAGSATILSSLEWALLVLATKPELQKRLQKEIDDNIGRDRSPKFADRNNMPLMHAFMWEIWRFRSLIPINLPRWYQIIH